MLPTEPTATACTMPASIWLSAYSAGRIFFFHLRRLQPFRFHGLSKLLQCCYFFAGLNGISFFHPLLGILDLLNQVFERNMFPDGFFVEPGITVLWPAFNAVDFVCFIRRSI